MARRSDAPSRGEITERIDKTREDLQEAEQEMDTTVCDIETIRGTLEGLEGGGTAEGGDEVESLIESAESETVDVFDEQDGDLEQLQQDGEEYQGELQEHSEVAESDLGKLSDASAQIETAVALDEFRGAKESSMRDIDFLEEQRTRSQDATEESDRVQQEYQQRVRTRTGG